MTEKKHQMATPRGRNMPGMVEDIKECAARNKGGGLSREEAEGTSITQGHKMMSWSLHFIMQERGQVTGNKLKLFTTFPLITLVCITASFALSLSCPVASTKCSPSYTGFSVSAEHTCPSPFDPVHLFTFWMSSLWHPISQYGVFSTLQTCNLMRKEGLNGSGPHSDNWQLLNATPVV